MHDCVFERYTCDLDLTEEFGGCTLCTRYCAMYRNKNCHFYILYSTKRSHRLFGESQCRNLYIKDKPGSLKSQCVNKLKSLLGESKTRSD